MRTHSVTFALLGLTCAALVAQEQQPPPQTFKSRVTVVPVDVRVLDRNGKPVTDLKREDFTILEDGVPQSILHFSFHQLTPMPAGDPDVPLDFRKPLGETVTPQNRRIFLLVLGGGRQVGPVKGVEAAMKFVKERLLPQDQVAILAYNRATDFTADHTKVLQTLERYWDKHESIEAKMRHHFSGLQAAYGSPEIPASIQKEIDAIFRQPGALASRSLTGTGATDAGEISRDTRRTQDQILRREAAADRLANNMGTAFDAAAVEELGMSDLSFDEYVQRSSDTGRDLDKLYAGVRYLRYLDGEKHLVFLTPEGLLLPRLENSNSIAALANDARVSVDIVHTGGVAGPPPMPPRMSGRSAINYAVPAPSITFGQRFAIESLRQISTLTGGTTTAFQSGASAFSRLDESTRAQYLIGYSPTNGNWNGAYRRISVRVNRKDVRVLYRHGYAARREITPLTRQQYLTYSRVAAAANTTRELKDFAFTTSTPTLEGAAGSRSVRMDTRIPPGAVRFTRADGAYIGKVEALYFCADEQQRLIGENWQTLDFKLTEENHQKFLKEGMSYTIVIPVTGEPRYVKSILYDYTADLVGSDMHDLKKPNK